MGQAAAREVSPDPVGGSKGRLAGTHRVRPPVETWKWISPQLSRYGITRVADVTGLDTIGVPVFMAVRPAAATLSVSQGKGVTPLLAKISAVMEAIELWHAEQAVPDVAATAAAGMGLPYAGGELAEVRGSLWHDDVPVDWVLGHSLTSGQPVPVPLGCVRLDTTFRPVWSPPLFAATSNGLASGNTLAEATVHALCEVVERDTAAQLRRVPAEQGTHLALDTVDDPECRHLLELFRSAGVRVQVRYDTGRVGTHLFEANGWADTAPVRFAGWGCHPDPAVALARALTEAAQSRLTAIAGSRDDDDTPIRHPSPWARPKPPEPVTAALSWTKLDDQSGKTIDDDLCAITAAVTGVTGRESIRVVLPSPTGVPVVKVVAPGLMIDSSRLAGGTPVR